MMSTKPDNMESLEVIKLQKQQAAIIIFSTSAKL